MDEGQSSTRVTKPEDDDYVMDDYSADDPPNQDRNQLKDPTFLKFSDHISSSEMQTKTLPSHLRSSFFYSMVETTWLINAKFALQTDDNGDDYQERLAMGVCFSSMGYIVTVSAGIIPKLQELQSVSSRKFFGRQYTGDFLELDFVAEDEESGLSLFRPKLANKYYYANVYDQPMDSVGQELLAIHLEGWSPFSFSRVVTALGASTLREMAEEPEQLAIKFEVNYPGYLYLPEQKYLLIQSMQFVDNPTDGNVWSSQSGSPIFDITGAIVGLACMGDPDIRRALVLAIPGLTIEDCIRRLQPKMEN